MAMDKAVDSTQLNADLTAVANAIRTKGGTSAQLAFPDGFVSAVQAIEDAPDLKIVVTTSAGATVTATKGSKTASGTADASGNCTLIVDEVGTWTVTAATASTTKTADVVVGTANVDLVMIDPVFGNNSWAAIIKACQEKQVPNTWNVGDSCNMTINNTTYAIDIIGKNHDDYADGSGKAPLTFQMHTTYATQYKMNGGEYNNCGWKNCLVRTSNAFPALKKVMPAEVVAALKAVTKKTTAGRRTRCSCCRRSRCRARGRIPTRARARSTRITRRRPTGRKTARGICARRGSAAPAASAERDGAVKRTGASRPRWTASRRHGAFKERRDGERQ